MAGEDPEYTRWLQWQPCAHCEKSPCEAHHKTGAGMGLRAHDHEAFSLCHWHHMDFHGQAGPFEHMDKQARRVWQEDKVKEYRSLWSVSDGVPF